VEGACGVTQAQTGATPERLALAARVRELRDQGLFQREVAEQLGISRSYAAALDTDPEGKQQRARRDSYDGVCVDCGGVTKSDGTSRPSARCSACAEALQSADRKWTRETVVDAIQRFAALHGRPPTASEWLTSDPVSGYPPRSAVYQSNGHNRSSPFQLWADAIEAAGYPRPRVGQYQRPPKKEGAMSRTRRFIVLEETDEGLWKAYNGIAALNEQLAIENHLASLADVNGAADHRYVAISEARWTVRQLQAVTSYRAVMVA
jgi:hypothetical protein